MSNTILTTDLLAKEALMIAHEKATFISTINRQYDSSFAKTGAKIGDALRVRKANQYLVTTASRAMDAQDISEAAVTLTMAYQYHVDMKVNSAELALSMNDFREQVLSPAMSVLVSKIDGDCITAATKATWNVAGTAGTVPGTVTTGFSDTSALGQARAKINQGMAPEGTRSLQMDSITMASLTNGVKGLVHPETQVRQAFAEGFLARTAMADLYENERTWSLSTSDDVAGTIDESAATNFVEGATKLHVDALGTTAIVAGNVFTIAGIYACHPETKAAYSHLQQFVVTTAVTPSSNECDISFQPAIYTTGAKKNVCTAAGADITWTYTAQDGQVVTFLGSTSTSYRQSLMYHRDAFAFISADLPMMPGGDCSRETADGLSLRVWKAGDIKSDELLMRIDMLWGFQTLNGYYASRITN